MNSDNGCTWLFLSRLKVAMSYVRAGLADAQMVLLKKLMGRLQWQIDPELPYLNHQPVPRRQGPAGVTL